MANPTTTDKLALSRLWVLMVTAFVDMIGYALILPLLPFYATRFGAGPAVVGILIGAYALAQLLTAPFWGRWSDRFGRRPVILGGQLLSAVAFLVFAVADSVPWLLLCRLLQGAGGGTMSATVAYVSDSAPPAERAKALGWLTAASSAGVMVGPAIGSLSVGTSYAAPGLLAAGFCWLNMLFTWRVLPESTPEKPRATDPQNPNAKPNEPTPPRLRQAALTILRHPLQSTSALIWIYTAGIMAFMGVNSVTALYLADTFGITEATIGWYYFAIGLTSVILRAVVLGPAVRLLGEVRVLRLGTLVLGSGMVLAPFADSLWQFLPLALLVPTGTALLFPATTSLISRYSPPEVVGQTLGLQQAFGGMSRLVGPVLCGSLYQAFAHGTPFWSCGALVWLTALFAFQFRPGEAPLPRLQGSETPDPP